VKVGLELGSLMPNLFQNYRKMKKFWTVNAKISSVNPIPVTVDRSMYPATIARPTYKTNYLRSAALSPAPPRTAGTAAASSPASPSTWWSDWSPGCICCSTGWSPCWRTRCYCIVWRSRRWVRLLSATEPRTRWRQWCFFWPSPVESKYNFKRTQLWTS